MSARSLCARSNRRRRGVSAVEIAISSTVAGIILLAAGMMTKTAGEASNAAFHRNGLMMRSNRVMDRLATELQVSGFLAEDANGNGTLDVGEDSNLNGVLDADWSLPEGQSATFITFNRVENRYSWSAPVTYRVQDGTLLRQEFGGTEKLICRDVASFQITRSAGRVSLRLELRDTDNSKRGWREVIERRVYVRN